MYKPDTQKLAREMTKFCEERVEKRTKGTTRYSVPKVVLRSVIGSLLAIPAVLDSVDRKSLW
jgi:hypothetical protein